jgi:hypothetical protein
MHGFSSPSNFQFVFFLTRQFVNIFSTLCLGKEKNSLLPLAFNLSFSPHLGKEKTFSFRLIFNLSFFPCLGIFFPCSGKIKGFSEHQNKKLPLFNTFCQEDRGE